MQLIQIIRPRLRVYSIIYLLLPNKIRNIPNDEHLIVTDNFNGHMRFGIFFLFFPSIRIDNHFSYDLGLS